MDMGYVKLKSETIAVLRNCRLPGGVYEETADGPDKGKKTYFVRCVPYLYGKSYDENKAMTDAERRAVLDRVLADLKAYGLDKGCIVSNNPEFGGDYLRVEHGSRTYNHICYMKS